MKRHSENHLGCALLLVLGVLISGIAITGALVIERLNEDAPVSITPVPTITSLAPTDTVSKERPQLPTRATVAATATPEPFVEEATIAPASYVGVTDTPGAPDTDWMKLPVLPKVSKTAKEIYARGIAKGNDPQAFSKIGDCQSIRQYFVGIFDDPNAYRIGEYEYLLPTTKNFHGSFDRKSLAVKTGWNVASPLSVLNADPKQCKLDETPLECEFRVQNPSIAIISMETWTKDRPINQYENYLRQIVEFNIDRGVVPILATKADNLEGNHAINAAIARVAQDYDVPLWNFWRVVQPLPDHGLEADGFHLTNSHNAFNDEKAMEAAWPNRNLTALMALDVVWRAVTGQEPSGAVPPNGQ
jgi:hypothetical protein